MALGAYIRASTEEIKIFRHLFILSLVLRLVSSSFYYFLLLCTTVILGAFLASLSG